MLWRMRCAWLLAAVAVALLGGCATIINGKDQTLQFESRPSGAKVFVNGHELGRTPVATELRRSRSYRVRMELKGYESFEIRLRSKVSGWYGMNAFSFGFIGLIVDAAVGSMYELQPRERSGRGRMLLHEGGRTYVRVLLQPQGRCRAHGADPVAKLRQRCRSRTSVEPLGCLAKGGRRDAVVHR